MRPKNSVEIELRARPCGNKDLTKDLAYYVEETYERAKLCAVQLGALADGDFPDIYVADFVLRYESEKHHDQEAIRAARRLEAYRGIDAPRA
eukprot:10958729-Alexandrium_andersonii.AAC.1